MTQEEKQLLLIDICARIPYGVKCKECQFVSPGTIEGIVGDCIYTYGDSTIKEPRYAGETYEGLRPYLRPMSSMTDEEKKEYTSYCFEQPFLQKDKTPNLGSVPMCIDWLNKNMFDYRGLIHKGLALEAPKDMYKDS